MEKSRRDDGKKRSEHCLGFRAEVRDFWTEEYFEMEVSGMASE
jgi:hypothetical protein